MEGSPFNRSAITPRSPPSTPGPVAASSDGNKVDEEPEMVPTTEIQSWLSTINQCLNEICAVSDIGKLNTDHKLRISNLCRKIHHSSSQMAIQYQSLKKSASQAHFSLRALKEQKDLSRQIKDLQDSIAIQNSIPRTESFADMVKKSANSFIQPSKVSAITVYPNDKLKTSEETKSLVQKIIRPGEMKLHVRGLRKIRNGGVLISTDSKDDIEKLKKSVESTSAELTVDEPRKRKPRIIIIGVPTSMATNEVLNCLYQQNLADKLGDLSAETVLTSITLSHKSGKKDNETCNYVIEVPAHIRKAIISQDRVFINWSSCPVRDFTHVTRCYKCQQYGHAAKTCKQEDQTCGHCGNCGHSQHDCPKKGDPPKCATCLRFKKPSDHITGDTSCPARQMAEKSYVGTIDYEGA